MPRGGPNRGQGRKPGSVNAKTREIAERAIGDGLTPLEVMLDAMRFYHEEAGKALEQLLADGAPTTTEGNEVLHAGIIEAMKHVLNLRAEAVEAAKAAAPYVHPRIGYAGEDKADDDFVPLAERLAHYQLRDDIEAAGGKVIELKPLDEH
jgi:hypothetical protein